jgi:hypothetical protein
MALTKDDLIHKVIQHALLDPNSGQNKTSADGLLYYMKRAGVKDISKGDIIKHVKGMKGLVVTRDGNIMVDVKEDLAIDYGKRGKDLSGNTLMNYQHFATDDEENEGTVLSNIDPTYSRAKDQLEDLENENMNEVFNGTPNKNDGKDIVRWLQANKMLDGIKSGKWKARDIAKAMGDDVGRPVKPEWVKGALELVGVNLKESVNEALLTENKGALKKVHQLLTDLGFKTTKDHSMFSQPDFEEDFKPIATYIPKNATTQNLNTPSYHISQDVKDKSSYFVQYQEGWESKLYDLTKFVSPNVFKKHLQQFHESVNEAGPTKGYIAVYRVMGQDFTVGPLKTNNKNEVAKLLDSMIMGGYRLMDIVPAEKFSGVKKYGGLMLGKNESVNEVSKKSVTKISNELASLADTMKAHAGHYADAKKANDAGKMKTIIGHLKTLTKQKKKLEKELDAAIGGLDKDVKLVATENIMRSQIRNMVRQSLVNEQSEAQKAYNEFFNNMLKEYDVKSPAELGDKKSEFFNRIKKEWKKKKKELGLNENKNLKKPVVSAQFKKFKRFVTKELNRKFGSGSVKDVMITPVIKPNSDKSYSGITFHMKKADGMEDEKITKWLKDVYKAYFNKSAKRTSYDSVKGLYRIV